MSAEVVKLDANLIAFNQGRIAYRRGDPQPPTPPERKPWVTPVNMFWLGYMTARGKHLMTLIRNGELPEDIE